MFSQRQINKAFDTYSEDVVINREDSKIPQKGFLVLDKEKDNRFDFGVSYNQSGNFFYSLYGEDLKQDDVLNYCGKKYLVTSSENVLFQNKVIYRTAKVEKM